LEKSNRQITPC